VSDTDDSAALKIVVAAPRLIADIDCLAQLFAADEAPVRYLRSAKICMAVYGFRDASSAGFASQRRIV
jgi:hypothetical protein